METWFYLEPDNNRNPPKDGPYCSKCMKPLDVKGEITLRWTIHPVHPWIKLDPAGVSLLGTNCWNKIKRYPVTESVVTPIH